MSGERSPEQAERCPTCDSPAPWIYFGGPCSDPFHAPAPPVVAADAPSEKVVGLMGALADAVDKAKADRAAAVPDEPADAERVLRAAEEGHLAPMLDGVEVDEVLAALIDLPFHKEDRARAVTVAGYQRVPEGSVVVERGVVEPWVTRDSDGRLYEVAQASLPSTRGGWEWNAHLRPLSAGDGDRSET